MSLPNTVELRTVWRRRLFRVFVVSLLGLAVLLAIGTPIVAEVWQPGYLLGPLVVAVEIVLVLTGVAWLALLVMSKRG